ncbi:MAG: 30S ribosomal protein S20, partial [Nitrospira sp.]|nr:30S ribosomal protein S20 [Nitrospira sp.]MCA9480548.1 30S ribosomal protein S20 [Nitrospira sp.]
FMKKVHTAVQDKNNDAAKTTLKEATSELHKAVTKGTLHRNTASRWISRLAARVNTV